MKIWLDDIRPAPVGYVWLRSVNAAKAWIMQCERKYADLFTRERRYDTNLLARYWDIDHDAGDYVNEGGDYIKILDWLEETRRNYPIHIHSQNPVGVENMRRIIQKNGWREIR